MSENIINSTNADDDLKKFLNIKDDPAAKQNRLNCGCIFKAISLLKKEWFTQENLSALLDKMRKCKIDLNAQQMHSILNFFQKNNSNLKFDDVIKSIFEINFVYKYDGVCCSNDFKEFILLLDFIIKNIDVHGFALNDVLKNIKKCKTSDMTTLLRVWNQSAKLSKQPLDIGTILDRISCPVASYDMQELLTVLTIDQKKAFMNHELIGRTLSVLNESQSAESMSKVAQKLKDYLTEDDTTIILNKTSPNDDAENIGKLVTQLKLTKDHLEMILSKLNKSKFNRSKATDFLKLVDKLAPLGFTFNKDDYKNKILEYLGDSQTADDVCALLDVFNKFKISLTSKLVDNIMNKSSDSLSADDVCKLLDKFNELGVKPKDNLNLVDDIIKKLTSDLTLDDVGKLLKKLKYLNVPLNLITNKADNDRVYAIVKRLKSKQSAQNLLELVKNLQSYGIQPIHNVCGHILSLLDENQNANDVTDLLIALGNIFGFDKIQKNTGRYLPGIDDILSKIEGNQSKDSIIKLAKVLIAMGKNLTLYHGHFRKKLKDYDESTYNVNDEEHQDLEELLKLNPNKDESKYAQKQKEFIKYFTTVKEESEEKKEDKKSKEEIISNNSINNKDEEGIILLEKITDANYSPLKINDESGNFNQFEQNKSKYKSEATKFVKDFTEVKKEAERPGELIQKVSLIRGQVVNSTGYNYNNGNINNKNKKNKIEIKTTNGASNKNLKILGVALAILGILCIILSLIIAESVLLSLLIPGCGLLTAGIISILVGLFCKHKSDEFINLSSGDRPPSPIGGNRNINDIEQQYPTKINIEKDNNFNI